MLPIFYSESESLIVGSRLYTDPDLTINAPDSFYSEGENSYEVRGGEILQVLPCVLPCDLAYAHITSTDPTLLGGTDGTITLEFSTTHGPTTYSLNLEEQGACTSPLVITGLSSNTPYTVVITDANNCAISTTVTLGQSATLFDADWIMVTYEFTNGSDLDTRTRIAVPNIGQDTQPEYLGWSCMGAWGPPIPYTTAISDVNSHIIMWGGDNTGIGFESILVNINKFRADYQSAPEFIVDLRGFWYGNVGTIPVVAAVTLWKGGTPVHDGCVQGTAYCWTNPTAQFTGTIESVPKQITLKPSSGNQSGSSGERIATLKYNLTTFVAVLNNADVTTPSV